MDPAAQEALGRALTLQGRHPEAMACFARLLALRPDHPQARRDLAAAMVANGADLAGRGEREQAWICCQGALRLDPDHPGAHRLLGELRQAQGQAALAVAAYERALALEPAGIEAPLKLAALHAQAKRFEPAAKYYRWALALDPGLEIANFNLSLLLENEGRMLEARIYRSRAARPQPLIIETAPEPGLRVLIPWAAGTGNVPIDTLLPPATTTRIRWIPECSTDEQEAQLPAHDLVFNAIGNADIAGNALDRLGRFQATHPMLNRPERVAATRRDLMPGLLAGIDRVLVPRCLRLRRDEVLSPGLAARLAAEGLPFPLLVRPIATQGGHGAHRVEDLEQLALATAGDADAFYFIAFHDGRGPDQHCRKYRVVFVDRKPYPYHLAISRHWLVHYYSADMLEAPWKREEERRFLEDPASVLGAPGWAALAEIGRRLDLDWAGIDFTVQADGQILVYEANATMLAHLWDSRADYPYKHEVVPAIFQAFDAMLRRTAVSSGTLPTPPEPPA